MNDSYDFGGWATRNDLKCTDGRIIMKDAFKHNDGERVPLVWNHDYSGPENILGHADLENREEGVYAYCTFNDTENASIAKALIKHNDIDALSIHARSLKQKGNAVQHGDIKEVSLVLAGANPGALIESIMKHGEMSDEEARIYTGEPLSLSHADTLPKKEGEETMNDIFVTLNEKQKMVVSAIIGQLLEDNEENKENKDDEDKGGNIMKHNVFDNDVQNEEHTLTHSDMVNIINEGKRCGSLKDAFLAHADTYGIDNIEYLFPDAKTVTNEPQFIKRPDSWVSKVMAGVHHTPFSRIKSIFADITADEARAKGYLKGNLKKNEVFSLLKRVTTPTTVYKKQKLDRDDVVDITDFDVVMWLKREMRGMLDEELARAFLFGDGRLGSSDDKINELNIRPIVSDSELFTISTTVTPKSQNEDYAKAFIRAAIKSRRNYRGTGTPTLFTSDDVLSDMLLLEDTIGHTLYKTEAELATALRVKEIVAVPADIIPSGIYGVIVNLGDYYVGADKGGEVNMFDDFDINYNQHLYLIETRCSGALTLPYSAIVLKAESVDPTVNDDDDDDDDDDLSI